MFGESGYDSIFDSNHDGHFDSFERDHAECFLHDCDTFNQVLEKEHVSSGGSSIFYKTKKKELTPEETEKILRTIPLFIPDSEKSFDERHPMLFALLFTVFIVFCFIMLGVSASLGVH